MAAYEAVLRVEVNSPEDLVKVVEVLSRNVVGLSLDGFSPGLASNIVCEGCEDCTEDEEDEDPDSDPSFQ